jgi:uncharacterized cupin superfamily protein
VERPNLFEPDLDEVFEDAGFRGRGSSVGERAGSESLGASLYEIDPGDTPYPFHWHVANEEVLLLITGTLELRGPDGVRTVEAGEVVAFPRGERGAHGFRNPGDTPARYLMLSEMNYPEICVYPDSGKVGVREHVPDPADDGMRLNFRIADAVDYFEGESAE